MMETSTDNLYPYIVPENDGVEVVLSFTWKNSRKLGSDYSSYIHYSNIIFDKYDFVAREQFETAYEHLKLVVLDEKEERILLIPERDKYMEIFKDFRRISGNNHTGVDISLSLKVIEHLLEDLNEETCVFNLYFFPDSKIEVKTHYTKIEILQDKVTKLEEEVSHLKKDIEMKFEIMKRDLEMRLEVSLRKKE